MALGSGRPRIGDALATLDARQWRTLIMMAVVVVGLHVLGFLTLLAVVAPRHYHLAAEGARVALVARSLQKVRFARARLAFP